MPIIFQKIIKREDLIRNRQAGLNILYVFGDNLERVGYGGQAREMRNEPNAVGVATKFSPDRCFGESDLDIIAQKRIIDMDMSALFEHVKKGGIVVWPADGIGTGLARLPEAAPTTFEYLEQKLRALVEVARLYDAYSEESHINEVAAAHIVS